MRADREHDGRDLGSLYLEERNSVYSDFVSLTTMLTICDSTATRLVATRTLLLRLLINLEEERGEEAEWATAQLLQEWEWEWPLLDPLVQLLLFLLQLLRSRSVHKTTTRTMMVLSSEVDTLPTRTDLSNSR